MKTFDFQPPCQKGRTCDIIILIGLMRVNITPTYIDLRESGVPAISHSRSELLITCDIGKIYNNNFVSKKLAPCQNLDEFDKKHSRGLFSIYVNHGMSERWN